MEKLYWTSDLFQTLPQRMQEETPNFELILEEANLKIREYAENYDHDSDILNNDYIQSKLLNFSNLLWEIYSNTGSLDIENTHWYAVLSDSEDTDWGTGSYSYKEAVDMVQSLRTQGHSDAHIAEIEMGVDPICVNEIFDFDY